MLWPKIDVDYQSELAGIVDGLRARGYTKLDQDDIVAMNGFMELADYYVPWLDKQTADRCADVKTGGGTLQRVCGDGKLYEKPPDRDGAQ